MKYDVLIVGAGMYGAVMAERLTACGKKVLVIDKRNHVGGNCFSSPENGIEVHRYGPHVFHTDSWLEWDYVNKFSKFYEFKQRTFCVHDGCTYNLPINLKTINDFFGTNFSPAAAETFIKSRRVPIDNPANLEEYAVSKIGWDLYEAFIKGYTTKQWGFDPTELPADILKRLPVRFTFDDSYHFEHFGGIPYSGWGAWFRTLLSGVDFKLNTDYFSDKKGFDELANVVIYTGPIDRFYSYAHGKLQYRSLRFELESYGDDFYQGAAVMNFPDTDVDFTRIVEYKHYFPEGTNGTVIVKEFPCWNDSEPYYPVRSKADLDRLKLYREMSQDDRHVFFGGRLAEYKYYDMNTTIKRVFEEYKKFI